MKECPREKQAIRNVVIKLRFRRAEASIRKCKHKIAKLNDIITKLKLEKKRRQSSENRLLNGLAERKDNQIAGYDARKELFSALIIRTEERESYLLQLDRLTARDRFSVYSSNLSDFIPYYSENIALVFLLASIVSGVACLVTGLSFILIVLTVIFFIIFFFLFFGGGSNEN